MSMEWLKGLVAPPAQFGQPGDQAAWVSPYATQGSAPQNAPQYANPQGPPQYANPQGAPPYANTPGAPPFGNAPSVPMQNAQAPAWAQQPGGPPLGGMPQASGDPRVAALEARCNELRHDVDSLALFARALLTSMMDKQILTQQQFIETKQKIDMLDGKLDDRVAPGV